MPAYKKRGYESSDESDFGHEEEAPEPVPRSRSGRRIKPKRWEDDSAAGAVEEEPRRRRLYDTDSGSDDHYSPEKRLPEAQFAVPAPKARHTGSASDVWESVPVRDEAGRFAGIRPRSVGEQPAISEGGGSRGGGIFKTAAIQVLQQEGRLMSTGEIAKVALKQGFVNVQGKTPEATMASALYTDIKRKEGRSVFIRPHEGLFGLRQWLDMGHTFTDPAERVSTRQPSAPRTQRLSKPVPVSASQRSGLSFPDLKISTKAQLRGTDGRFRSTPLNTVTAARSWSEPADSAFVRTTAAGQHAPATSRRAPRQYSTNLDMLFAAVDEVSGASVGGTDDRAEPAVSDEEVGKAESATARADVPAEQKHFPREVTGPHHGSTEAVSGAGEFRAAPSLADPVLNVAAQIVLNAQSGFLAKLMHIHKLEAALQAMEENLGKTDPRLGQAHLQMFKLYQDAGLQEKAHKALTRAYEISDAAATGTSH